MVSWVMENHSQRVEWSLVLRRFFSHQKLRGKVCKQVCQISWSILSTFLSKNIDFKGLRNYLKKKSRKYFWLKNIKNGCVINRVRWCIASHPSWTGFDPRSLAKSRCRSRLPGKKRYASVESLVCSWTHNPEIVSLNPGVDGNFGVKRGLDCLSVSSLR